MHDDVFVSFTRTGHPDEARIIWKSLKEHRISAFIDEDVPVGQGISPGIITALEESRIMVVVYSASYNARWACQWELIYAYLTGIAEGSAAGRILIVNPEPGEEHILPIEIADMKFLRPGQLDLLVETVERKLAEVTEPMKAVKPADPAKRAGWFTRDFAGAFGFTGRFRELWSVHNALSRIDKPLTATAYSPPVAVITGITGIGKTYLARAYGWLFQALYPGRVFYVDVHGSARDDGAHDRFASAVRDIAVSRQLDTAGLTSEQVTELIADHAAACELTELWIVDDLPANLDDTKLANFVIPGSHIRTVLTARSCAGGVEVINLTGLDPVDGLAVLGSGRPIDPADLTAAESIVRELGGHPLALATAAGYLRDHEGPNCFADYQSRLETAGPDPDILARIGRSMSDLTNSERTTIALAGALGNTVPNELIRAVLAAGHVAGPAEQATDAVIRRLREGGFAVAESSTLRIHPLVVQASALIGPPVVPLAQIAVVAARNLTSLLADRPDDQVLIGAARLLAQGEVLDEPRSALSLSRQVAAYAERTGDLAQAAAFWHRVTLSRLSSEADAVAAALACVANAEFERGIGHARTALDAGVTGGLRVQAQWAWAAGLDGVGRFDQANELWAGLAKASWTPAPAKRMAFDVARARAMLARGRLAEARSILDSVLNPPAAIVGDPDQLNAAHIEMARLLLWTGREREGRKLAESVVSYYEERGTPGHAQCLAAELVWAELAFALGLFELRPDRSKWTQAGKLLDRLVEDFPQAAGPHSFHGPATSVLHGLVLAWQGKPRECVKVLLPALPSLQDRLGARHPLILRAQFALSLAYSQLEKWADAANLLAEVWPTQRMVIGPRHPDTLHSHLQYGIALKMADQGQDRLSAQVLSEFWSILPKEVGRLNDLNGQGFFAQALRWTPQTVLHSLVALSKWLDRRSRGGK
jgi:hypothetical protein